ncbi:MAG: pantoate--beta-alanine ligase [Chloroflexi bacterium]|nr:pantoate--beta-alanine ligase [Chloroflexota bacterium]MDP6498135.1 pantoate--beta-alanine ligase [Dehalococcoidia bacterium]MQG10624.1 pantoate--beta-alanine ligase [SAR202 cluster bacterium]MQG55206.1 pantoate--beta-alanine ligase [SAR202 cluster bacterium]
MRVISTNKEMSQACREALKPVGLVPTMGALHPGHLSLVGQARADNLTVAVSIFVNPTQFGDKKDLQGYPRDMEGDINLLRQHGVDLVYAPKVEEVYPDGFDTWVDVGPLADKLEGLHRPGHFRGVATVVSKLFNVMRPDRAYFGQKDGQQVVVIQKLARDLDMGVEVVIMPTIRELDGLAMSSRNVQLTPEQRQAAPVVHSALCQAYLLWTDGERDGDKLRQAAQEILRSESMVDSIDYVSVANISTLDEVERVEGRAMVSAAAHMGPVRLIDNLVLE